MKSFAGEIKKVCIGKDLYLVDLFFGYVLLHFHNIFSRGVTLIVTEQNKYQGGEIQESGIECT